MSLVVASQLQCHLAMVQHVEQGLSVVTQLALIGEASFLAVRGQVGVVREGVLGIIECKLHALQW